MQSATALRPAGFALVPSSFVARLLLGLVLIDVFVTGMVMLSLDQSRRQLDASAASTAQNLAQVLAETVAGEIDKIDVALQVAADEIARETGAGGVDRQQLNAFLARLQSRLPETISMRTLDARGFTDYGRGADPRQRQDNSDREYYTRQRDEPHAGLVIAKPVFARIDKKWVIPLSRPIRQPDGSFGGVVYVNVALEHLTQTFSHIDVGSGGSVSLRDTEMRIFARYPIPADVEKIVGERLVVAPLQELIRSGREGGAYTTNQTVDGVERKFAVRALHDRGLYIVLGRSTDEYLAPWRGQVRTMLGFLGLFLAITIVSAWAVIHAWRRRKAAIGALIEERASLRRAYAYNRSLIEASLDPLVTIGPDGKITDVNTATEKATGRARDGLIGTDFSEYFSAPDKAAAGYRRVFADGAVRDYELEIRHQDGHLTPVVYNAAVYRDEAGGIVGVFAAARDISERKRVEEELRRLNQELEERVRQRTRLLEAANRELEELSYSMSHDMRTPLRAIDGYSKLLQDEFGAALDSEGDRMLTLVRSNAQRMACQIDDVLRFLDLRKRRIECRVIDIAELAHEVFLELQVIHPARRLRLVVDDLPLAWGDEKMVRQVLANLLSNAIKFSPAEREGTIEISGRAALEANVYSVTDHGIGFDMRYVGKLFKIFERVHATGSYEGTGIGLAMVRRIIERHGGQVWAEGRIGQGASFHFSLPNRESSQAAVHDEAPHLTGKA